MLKNKLFCSMVVFAVAAIFATTLVGCGEADPAAGWEPFAKKGDVVEWEKSSGTGTAKLYLFAHEENVLSTPEVGSGIYKIAKVHPKSQVVTSAATGEVGTDLGTQAGKFYKVTTFVTATGVPQGVAVLGCATAGKISVGTDTTNVAAVTLSLIVDTTKAYTAVASAASGEVGADLGTLANKFYKATTFTTATGAVLKETVYLGCTTAGKISVGSTPDTTNVAATAISIIVDTTKAYTAVTSAASGEVGADLGTQAGKFYKVATFTTATGAVLKETVYLGCTTAGKISVGSTPDTTNVAATAISIIVDTSSAYTPVAGHATDPVGTDLGTQANKYYKVATFTTATGAVLKETVYLKCTTAGKIDVGTDTTNVANANNSIIVDTSSGVTPVTSAAIGEVGTDLGTQAGKFYKVATFTTATGAVLKETVYLKCTTAGKIDVGTDTTNVAATTVSLAIDTADVGRVYEF